MLEEWKWQSRGKSRVEYHVFRFLGQESGGAGAIARVDILFYQTHGGEV